MTDEEIKELVHDRNELAMLVEVQAAVLKRMRDRSLRWNQRISHWYKLEEAAYAKAHIKKCRICGKVGHNYDV